MLDSKYISVQKFGVGRLFRSLRLWLFDEKYSKIVKYNYKIVKI